MELLSCMCGVYKHRPLTKRRVDLRVQHSALCGCSDQPAVPTCEHTEIKQQSAWGTGT